MYYICDVVVDERHRGKQIGKRLVNEIVTEKALKDMYEMLLTSDAQGLYSQYMRNDAFVNQCFHAVISRR